MHDRVAHPDRRLQAVRQSGVDETGLHGEVKRLAVLGRRAPEPTARHVAVDGDGLVDHAGEQPLDRGGGDGLGFKSSPVERTDRREDGA